MCYLLDTCVISDFVKGDRNTLAKVKASRPTDISISSITLMEVQYGLKVNPAKAKKIQPVIDDLFCQIRIIPFGERESEQAAEIRAALKAKGKPIGAYDLLIAATARSNALTVVTSNTHEFERVPNLRIENWRAL